MMVVMRWRMRRFLQFFVILFHVCLPKVTQFHSQNIAQTFLLYPRKGTTFLRSPSAPYNALIRFCRWQRQIETINKLLSFKRPNLSESLPSGSAVSTTKISLTHGIIFQRIPNGGLVKRLKWNERKRSPRETPYTEAFHRSRRILRELEIFLMKKIFIQKAEMAGNIPRPFFG